MYVGVSPYPRNQVTVIPVPGSYDVAQVRLLTDAPGTEEVVDVTPQKESEKATGEEPPQSTDRHSNVEEQWVPSWTEEPTQKPTLLERSSAWLAREKAWLIKLSVPLMEEFQEKLKTWKVRLPSRNEFQQKLKTWASSPQTPRLVTYAALGFVALGLVGFGILQYQVSQLDPLIQDRLRGGAFDANPRVLAAPRTVRVGDQMTVGELTARLERAGYGSSGENFIGSFSINDGKVSIEPGPLSVAAAPSAVIRVADGRVRAISDSAGRGLKSYRLEPEAVTRLANSQGERRSPLRYEEIPPQLINAVIAVEDHRFYKHSGVDVLRTAKAAWEGLTEWRMPRGTSTLTQQLARGFFLTRERTISRKLKEFLIARNIERQLSKERILELYSNLIYMGRQGGHSIAGFGEAARAYFAKEVDDLELHESALLAGLLQRPSYLNPFRHPERAKARRDTVLDAMRQHGYITGQEYNTAVAQPVEVVETDYDVRQAPYFVDLIERELEQEPGLLPVLENGGEVYTTLDADLQAIAVRTVREVMREIDEIVSRQERFQGQEAPRPECALVAIDPHTGEVKALVGGRDYERTQLNRALAKRQPGSLFKPFVYAAAFTFPDKMGRKLTPISIVEDTPLSIEWDDEVYEPSNFGHDPHGFITLRQALVNSVNTSTVRVARYVGYSRVASLGRKVGMGNVGPTPSAALGAYESTPLEVAGAYTALANKGVRVQPRLIQAVRGATDGNLIEQRAKKTGVLDPAVAFLVSDLMIDVLNRGTGYQARAAGFQEHAAGKTGTDDDGWFAGFTDKLLCVVWVGFDDNRDLQIEGAKSALPIWAEFMKKAAKLPAYRRPAPLEKPEEVVEAEVDPFLALAAPAGVELPEREWFLTDAQPAGPLTVIRDPEIKDNQMPAFEPVPGSLAVAPTSLPVGWNPSVAGKVAPAKSPL